MGEPTIKRGSDHFFTTLYEGTGLGRKVGKFQPFTASGTIANSVIFNDGDTPAISRTLSGDGNKKKFTISFWMKRCVGNYSTYQAILVGGGTSGSSAGIFINSSQQIYIYLFGAVALITTQTFEDQSRWYHIVLRVDTSDSTADDRVRLYVDGTQITSFGTRNNPSQEAEETLFNVNAKNIDLGRHTTSTYYYDGYMAEVNFADGQSYGPETFGVTDTSTGRWVPKTLSGITYGTNGFRLAFGSAAALGTDTSGNGNNFTPVNLSTTDQTTDNPNDNFMNFGGGYRSLGTQQTTEEGGLTIYASSGSGYTGCSVHKEIPQSGKWYWEVKLQAVGAAQGISNPAYGVIDRNIKEINNFATSSEFSNQLGGMGATFWSGFRFTGLLGTATELTIGSYTAATNDYVAFAFDMDNGKAWWGFKDGSADLVWYASDGGSDGNPATGANPTVTFNPKNHRFVPAQGFYAPGAGYSARYHYNFGQKTHDNAAPTGYSSLSTSNFPESNREKPDLVWIKNRDATDNWQVYDSTRGPRLDLSTNTTDHQSSTEDGLQQFLKAGFQIEDDVSVNTFGESYVAYNWKANGGTEVSNGDGSVTSNVQVNSDAGFSIVRYTGTGSALDVGHGLSQAPEWIVARPITQTGGYHWSVYLKYAGGGSTGYYQSLNQYIADTSNSTVWDAHPTSTVVNCGSAMPNGAHETIMYCWHSVPGYSQIGAFNGNASTDGPYIYLGFKPAWLLLKAHNTTSWYLMDKTRDRFNTGGKQHIYPNVTAVEDNNAGRDVDFLASGFKVRQESGYGYNYSGTRTHYMAFAEHPFIGTGSRSPTTAV